MSAPLITEAAILRYASVETFRLGRSDYQRGAVIAPVLYENRLLAEVNDEQSGPEFVYCLLWEDGSLEARCTCQKPWGGWCKHMVATCLVLLFQPEKVTRRPSWEQMLAPFKREELQALVMTLAEQVPHLAATLDQATEGPQPVPSQKLPNGTAPVREPHRQVDTRAVQRQVGAALHSLDRMRSSEAYWHVSGVVGEVEEMAQQALDIVAAGDGPGALAHLEAVTDSYVKEWFHLDDSDGSAGELFTQLGKIWAEVLLSVDLSPKERKAWARKLTAWQKETAEYGVDDAFDIASTAALQG